MKSAGELAVVIGAGMGGLSAAAALSAYFEKVVVFDRDTLPLSVVSRAGIPQDRHSHGILAGGLQALEALVPGYQRALAGAGAVRIDLFKDFRFERPDVGAMPQRDCGVSILSASRPLIEAVLRQQVLALPNVALRSPCRATAILATGMRPTAEFINEAGDQETIQGDLVVDACGRGALTLALLDQLGWARPMETTVGVDISYTTAIIPWNLDQSRSWRMVVTNAEPPALPSAAFLLPAEEGRCYLTLAEHHASTRPQNWDELLAALRGLKTTTIYDAVYDLAPLDDLSYFVFNDSQWRHFEKLEKLPPGVLPIADSLCRFNPFYGQGMSVAARQAKLLQNVLSRIVIEADQILALQSQFMADVSAVLQLPWMMGVNADFAYRGTRGTPPENYEEGRQFEAALFRAAVADPAVQRALAEVMQLVKPADLLQRPDIKQRIEAHAPST